MTDLSLQHLQLELARIDVLIQRAVRLFQLAGHDPADDFRGLYVSDEQADTLSQRSFGANLFDTVSLETGDARAFDARLDQTEQEITALVERARQAGELLRLGHFAAAFGLDRFDLDAFLICLAPTLDLRYERIYGYLHDDITKRHASANLTLDLLAQPGVDRLGRLARFGEGAPLRRYRLLDTISQPGETPGPVLGQRFVPDESIVSWLLGRYEPHSQLASAGCTLTWPQRNDADVTLAGAAWEELQSIAEDTNPLVVFTGPDGEAQRAAGRLLAAQRGRPLLTVNLGLAEEAPTVLRLALRDGLLAGAVPYVAGWDAILGKSSAPPVGVLGEVVDYPGLVVVAGAAEWRPSGMSRTRILVRQDFPLPRFEQRLALWQHFFGDDAPEADDVIDLATQFLLTTEQIRDAVTTARDIAARHGRELTGTDVFQAAREHSNPNLGNQARKIVPRYSWDDIVVPTDQRAILQEVVNTVRGRPKVLEEWGVGEKLASSAGVTVLFAGEPGTGKTMAAEVIAAELGLDLYKIDLSGVVSKYIGETEKNLERIFTEAQSSNAILFFDEADAIFGKRSEVKDAHDRYANIETSYLLQRMEAYDGVTILATNLRANIDEAFTRRLHFAVDFPFPEEADRLLIWETLFPPTVPRAADVDLGLMARRFKLTGGNIRNIIVSAAFLAASDGGAVTMQHMLHGARREMQKMGRLLKERDLSVEVPDG